MRLGPRVSVAFIAIVLAAVFVVTSHGRSRAEELHSGPDHPVWAWQGPFQYVRDFGARVPGCSYHGREVVEGTMVCEGTDLRHLRCTATGTASHDYDEQQPGGLTRKDSGTYEGPLQIAFDTHQTKGVDLFRLDVGANLQVHYQEDGAASKSGQYLLDVAGTTSDLVFEPQNARLERRRVQPIYEPGPAACGVKGKFNGTETVSMRLLPAD